MQVGTDGRVACATCHFHAGADGRTKNQINPGPNGAFQAAGPNETLDPSDFPFHQRGGLVDFQASPVLRDWDDIGGSQGVRKATFGGVTPGAPADITIPEDDPVFQVGGVEVRQVTAVSAPSVINAIFNYSNLWDGAAKTIFNGVNTSGAADQNARIFVQTGSGLQPGIARIPDASVASQAVGPPINSTEMSSIGRSFPDIGKKLLTLTPLGQQLVHVNDSVLGLLSRQRVTPGQPGLNTTYADMIKAAFHPQYWSNEDQIVTFSGGTPTISPRPAGSLGPGQYTQMEANFSLFFGLAVQLYEATLVSADAPFDGAGGQVIRKVDIHAGEDAADAASNGGGGDSGLNVVTADSTAYPGPYCSHGDHSPSMDRTALAGPARQCQCLPMEILYSIYQWITRERTKLRVGDGPGGWALGWVCDQAVLELKRQVMVCCNRTAILADKI